jgi:hypothetical protein
MPYWKRLTGDDRAAIDAILADAGVTGWDRRSTRAAFRSLFCQDRHITHILGRSYQSPEV